MKKLSFKQLTIFSGLCQVISSPWETDFTMLLMKEDGDICIKKSPDLHTFKNHVDYAILALNTNKTNCLEARQVLDSPTPDRL